MLESLPSWVGFAASAVTGYLFGSIPFGLVLTRMAGLGDIRAIGSGNIGATNVLRTGRKDIALATLLLDAGKAGIACLACGWLFGPDAGFVGGAVAFLGHCFPVWLGFKGGKGVATFVGLMLAAMWQVGLGFAAIWLLMAAIFRMSSLSALVAALASPVLVHLFGYGPVFLVGTILLVVLVFWRHTANIKRLLAGTEPRMGAKKKAEAEAAAPEA